MEDSTYKKISAIVDSWLEIHQGETFDLDLVCRQLQINERENRQLVAIKLAHEVKQQKLEKLNRIYRYINKDKDIIDWYNSDVEKTLSINFPKGRDGSKFGFDGCVCISPGDIIVVAGVSNMGKGHPLGTLVLTEKGWQRIEKLKPNTSIFNADGQPSKVSDVFFRGTQPCYKFYFNDGTSIIADNDHIWRLLYCGNRKHRLTGHGNNSRKYGEWENQTTHEIIKRCGLGDIKAYYRPLVPTISPIEFPRKDITLDPYLVGLLLGDGGLTHSTPIFSTADNELVESFKNNGYKITKVDDQNYRILGIIQDIRNLGMYGKWSYDKFVPLNYLWNSITIRQSVLAGLLDTDGSIDKLGAIEYSTCSQQLANDVTFLARSLGARVSHRERLTHYTYKGIKRAVRQNHRLVIKFANYNPFRLTRKRERWSPPKKTANRAITRIEPVGELPTICISTNDPSGLYIVDNFIVSHNTTFAQNFLWENMDNYPCALMGNEYTPVKFKRRISRMTWNNPIDENGKPKFELIRRLENWADIIEPDKITIIDWIALPANELYNIGHVIQGIQSKVGNGIALIVLQKDEASNLGRGRAFSEELASLYLTIDKKRMTVRKAKEWFEHDPNREVYGFDIANGGVEFRNIRPLVKCFNCKGSGQIKGNECFTCHGTGYIEKKEQELDF